MNNAFYPEDFEEQKPDTSDEQARLTRLIESLSGIASTKEWITLHELHFSREEERIKRLLLSESKTTPIDTSRLYRLQGELIWAQRYGDVRKWVTTLTSQLKQLKNEQ